MRFAILAAPFLVLTARARAEEPPLPALYDVAAPSSGSVVFVVSIAGSMGWDEG